MGWIDREESGLVRPAPPKWSPYRFCEFCPAQAPGPDNVFEHAPRCRMNPANYRRFSRWKRHLTEGLGDTR